MRRGRLCYLKPRLIYCQFLDCLRSIVNEAVRQSIASDSDLSVPETRGNGLSLFVCIEDGNQTDLAMWQSRHFKH